jgi:predicted nucleic-acid-binding Zn-ribbon protein
MRDGICPKCGRATVHSGRDVPAKSSTGNRIPIDFQHSAPLDNYVCVSCGYVERYIAKPDDLQRIEQKWRRAGKNKNDVR